MSLSGNKKVLLLGIILLIVASIVVVLLKGVNVPLYLEQHEAINVEIGKEIKIVDVKTVVDEVFKNKKTLVRNLELFSDSANIIVQSVTDEEKKELVNKLNEKFETQLTVDDLNITKNANIRVRDLVRPYIKPAVISMVIIVAYMLIRYRKMDILKMFGNVFGFVVLSEAVVASIVVIARIPVSATVINLMVVLAVSELIYYLNKLEKTN